MIIRAIDPGPIESAYVDWDGENVWNFGKVENTHLASRQHDEGLGYDFYMIFIEMVASYGMPVGKDVFETALWTGCFIQHYSERCKPYAKVYRKDIKMHLCGSSRAKDSNITTAIVDRFDPMREYGQYGKGTKKNPGMFYGFAKDHWAAFAVALYAYDCFIDKKEAA